MASEPTFSEVKLSPVGAPIRWLVVGGLLLIAAIVVGTTIMAGNFRQRALEAGKRELENTVLLLTRHFDQQFKEFGAIHQDLARFVENSGIDSPDRFRRKMSGADIHQMLESKLGALSYNTGLHLFDSDGRLINSTSAWPVGNVSIADRPYFKSFKTERHSADVQIEQLQSRITGKWTTVVARRITGPGGEFLGVVGRGFDPANFEQFFASVALGQDAAISLVHRNGAMLARYPHMDEAIGRNFQNSPLIRRVLQGEGALSDVFTNTLKGEERLGAIKALDGFPLMVLASTSVSAVLADWHQQMRFLIGVGTSSILLITALLSMVVRKLLQEHRWSRGCLTREKERLDKAINNMSMGLLLFDSSQKLVVCNRRYIDMYGLSPDVVKPGCSFREIIEHRKATGSFAGDVDQFVGHVLDETVRRNVMVVDTADGRSIQIVNEPLADGGWVATHEDITERRRTEERVTHLAHYDALTDLPNRALFHEKLKSEMAFATPERQLAVVYIDIDEFKSVNDSLGHMIGDELLKAVASRLKQCVRPSDFVARLGGDEFAIIQTGVETAEDGISFVHRVLEAIRTPIECMGHLLSADASIGIALAPEHGVEIDQILKNADLAMYAAKAAGRRTYRFFQPEMDAEVKNRRQLEVDLRQAIAKDELEVYYQPCLGLQDDRITGCEALVRWRHPKRGMISPAEFIPIAEETGLINQIGEWVLSTACAEAATWPENTRIAVNVSPVQFKSGTLALKIMSSLAASGLPAARLELEITEAVLIRDDDVALAILHQLRAIGIRIALDDFGTGYSSLSYLQRFPFDKIKIDRAFVKDIAEAGGSPTIVQAVVNIAAAQNMTTTAEGVETEAQQHLLRKLGCSEMQGFLFSAPKPAAEARALLFAHRDQLAAARSDQDGKRRALTKTA
jgi:diguanylate cyclase (GGDEF)-like protein